MPRRRPLPASSSKRDEDDGCAVTRRMGKGVRFGSGWVNALGPAQGDGAAKPRIAGSHGFHVHGRCMVCPVSPNAVKRP